MQCDGDITVINTPHFHSQSRLESDLNKTYPYLINKIWGWYPNQSLSYAMSKNFVKVNVYYDRLAVTEVTESPSYGPDLFIADIGKPNILLTIHGLS